MSREAMDIEALLASERRRGGFSNDERAAMWRGISRSLGVAGTIGAVTVAATAAAAAKSATPEAAGKAVSAIARWKIGAILSAVAIGGAGVGAAAHAQLAEPKVVKIEVPAPAQVTTASQPTAIFTTTPSALPAASASVVDVHSATSPRAIAPRSAEAPVASASAAPKDPSLARERTLIDMARTALARGDAASALSSLDAHAREFPSSQLGPEREVLAIQALAASGRLPEARRRAATFRTTYPKSPLHQIVDEATQ